MSYGSRIGNLNATAQSLSQGVAESEESYRDDLIKKSEDAEEASREKFADIQGITTDITQPVLGVSQLYKTTKAIRASGRKVKDSLDKMRGQFQEPEGDEDVGFNPDELPFPEASVPKVSIPKVSLPSTDNVVPDITRSANAGISSITEDAEDMTFNDYSSGQSISSSFTKLGGGDGEQLSGTTSKLASALTDDSGDVVSSVGKAVASSAGDVLEDVAGSQVLDAIPIVGEATAIIGGLVSAGEGIYSLFHHTSTPAPPPPPNPRAFLLGSDVQQKYASDIPSLDTSVDRDGGSGVF